MDDDDALDDVLAAFSDHLDHGTPCPALDHLDPYDRHVIEDLMRLIETGRRIDPSLSAPSLEALLAGTEFADASTMIEQRLGPGKGADRSRETVAGEQALG
jgi:hypothetical protein